MKSLNVGRSELLRGREPKGSLYREPRASLVRELKASFAGAAL